MRRFREAIISLAEAVDIHRTTAADGRPTSLHHLAGSLHNLPSWQGRMEQRAEALANITEAVRIRRALAEANPDAFRPDLAGSLANLAHQQKWMGKIQDALSSVTESVSVLRKLAESDPDAFQPDFAIVLKDLAGTYYDLGQHAEALALGSEAVGIDSGLARKNPAAHLPGLADALQKQALAHSAMGEALRLEQAKNAWPRSPNQCVFTGSLAGADPDVHNSGLANSLAALVNCLDQVGEFEEARNAMAEYLNVLRPLTCSHPATYEAAAEQASSITLSAAKDLDKNQTHN